MIPRTKHVPLRLCAGCSRRDRKGEMDRFTVVDGRLVWEGLAGRGAYLHRRDECAEAFVARKPFVRSLGASISKAERARLIRSRN